MNWRSEAIEQLARQPVCGYAPRCKPEIEPTAVCSMALGAYGRSDAAAIGSSWLQGRQRHDGAITSGTDDDLPGWPTGLTVMSWIACSRQQSDLRTLSRCISGGLKYLLSIRGTIHETAPDFGHDASIVGWPWVDGTHSWIEPTAMNLMALKSAHRGNHERSRQATRLLVDRLLPTGGCNYGNTTVLGQMLRPHVQPSGMVMAALHGCRQASARIPATLAYLRSALHRRTTSASLAWALLGLHAHYEHPADAEDLLAAAYDKTIERDRSPYKIALLLLAALGRKSPIIALQQS